MFIQQLNLSSKVEIRIGPKVKPHRVSYDCSLELMYFQCWSKYHKNLFSVLNSYAKRVCLDLVPECCVILCENIHHNQIVPIVEMNAEVL